MMKARTTLILTGLLLSAVPFAAAQSIQPLDSLNRAPLVDISADFDAAGSAQIAYQGALRQGEDPAEGSFDLTFAIYNQASDGTALWSETKNLSVVEGVFETNLGDVTPLDLPFDEPYWLGVTVNTDAEMQPRTMLTATPYSFSTSALQGRPVAEGAPNSGDVLKWDGAAWSPSAATAASPWTDQSGSVYYNGGKVGIGTDTPEGAVHVVSNGSLSDPQIRLHENANDYARLNFENNNGSNYWSIAAYVASNNNNDRLNFWNGASGDLMTITGDGEVGIGVGISPKVDFHLGDGKRVLFGTDTVGYGDKLMFDPGKHAFRVGTVATGAASTYWDPDSIGLYSFASGLNTRAQGFGGTAMGRDTEAVGSYAFASGYFSNADGQYSTAMGFNTDALGLGSTALGYSTDAEENYSFAAGYFAEAQAIYSVAIGNAVHAQSYASTALGRYNVGGGSATSWLSSDPIFEIGIGTGPSARANAVTVRKNGNVGIGTTVPLDALHVNGRIRLATVEYFEDGGTNEIAVRGDLRPTSDNSYDLGTSTMRWDDVYATNGTIVTSDIRLKTNVEPVESSLEKVMSLRPVNFEWRDGTSGGMPQAGLIAQEVLQVFPDAVKTTDRELDEDGETIREVPVEWLGINYHRLIPRLISAMQEQQELIESLQQRIADLENR